MSGANGTQPNGHAPDADWAALAQQFLDPQVLERMANDFYRDVAPAVEGAWDATLPDLGIFAIDLPLSEADAAAPYVASADGLVRAASSAVEPSGFRAYEAAAREVERQSGWGSTGIREGLNTGVIAADAAYGWLTQARPLFGAEHWTGFEALAWPGSPSLDDRVLHPASPQVWGAITPAADSAARSLPGFLGQVRPVTDARSQLPSVAGFDAASVRRDFPILNERVEGRPLVWLDNAATTQKPRAVIDRLSYFYEHENSNIHRAAHTLAARSTDAYEGARDTARHFLNAAAADEIVFVRGTTEGINLVAQSWGRANIGPGDEILITWLEHHANIVPWQMLAQEKRAHLRVVPVDDDGQVIVGEFERLLTPRTRLVAITHVSNALGTVTPVQELTALAHRAGATVLVDGAQAVSHMPVDVQALGADFYVFSGHKVFGPTGIGVVYGRSDVLEQTPPWQGGGNMIADVTFDKTQYREPPTRFEAGTGNIADAVGLGAALDYVMRIGMANIAAYEHELLDYATDGLKRIPNLRLIGTAPGKAGVLSFVLDGFKTEDIGAALSREGIAVRAGHHCAQPILRRFGVESTVRPSLALYNDCTDIDALVAALWNLKQGRAVGPN